MEGYFMIGSEEILVGDIIDIVVAKAIIEELIEPKTDNRSLYSPLERSYEDFIQGMFSLGFHPNGIVEIIEQLQHREMLQHYFLGAYHCIDICDKGQQWVREGKRVAIEYG